MTDKFELNQLRALVSVIETGSFSAAAQQQKQTQSAVSQLIASLEQALGCQLFDRRHRPVKPTLIGRQTYQHARRILQESQRLHQSIEAAQSGRLPQLRMGLMDSLAAVIGLPLITQLHSQVNQISLLTGTAPELISALQAGRLDLIMAVVEQETVSSLVMTPLFTESFFIVTPTAWRTVSLKALSANFPYIAYAGNTPTGVQTSNWLKWRGMQVESRFTLSRAEPILTLVAQNQGWTLATPFFLADNPTLFTQLHCQPIDKPGLKRQIVLMTREGELEQVIAPLKQSVTRLIQTRVVEPLTQDWPWMEIES